jgi:hypothetical protein
MRRQAEQAGLHMSVRELLDTLAGIQESVLLFHCSTTAEKDAPAPGACSPT